MNRSHPFAENIFALVAAASSAFVAIVILGRRGDLDGVLFIAVAVAVATVSARALARGAFRTPGARKLWGGTWRGAAIAIASFVASCVLATLVLGLREPGDVDLLLLLQMFTFWGLALLGLPTMLVGAVTGAVAAAWLRRTGPGATPQRPDASSARPARPVQSASRDIAGSNGPSAGPPCGDAYHALTAALANG